jgi:hypothetical protein
MRPGASYGCSGPFTFHCALSSSKPVPLGDALNGGDGTIPEFYFSNGTKKRPVTRSHRASACRTVNGFGGLGLNQTRQAYLIPDRPEFG